MTRPDQQRLRGMLDAINDIRLCTTAGWESFKADRITQHAVMHCLTVIGECASRITPATRSIIPSLAHQKAAGLRNIIVHEYWRIDLEGVWTTITRDLPPLYDDIRHVLHGVDRSLDL